MRATFLETCSSFGDETRMRRAAFVVMFSVMKTWAPGTKAAHNTGVPLEVTTVAPVSKTLAQGADRSIPSTKVKVFPRRATTVPERR
jgi:hypothetical protein